MWPGRILISFSKTFESPRDSPQSHYARQMPQETVEEFKKDEIGPDMSWS